MSGVVEQHFLCPCCNASVSVLLDASAGAQEYVEDCEVCCRPIRVQYRVEDDAPVDFCASALDEV